jgi:hypothetical protein
VHFAKVILGFQLKSKATNDVAVAPLFVSILPTFLILWKMMWKYAESFAAFAKVIYVL